MRLTALNSPSETRAEAISIRSTWLFKQGWAKVNFSEAEKETPEVCSPSRRVVSMISILRVATSPKIVVYSGVLAAKSRILSLMLSK